MKKFRYRAKKNDGTNVEGVFEGNSKDDVINMITSSDSYPLMIEEVVEGTSFKLKFLDRVTTKDLAIFCRQFYTMLDAGVSIISCINILANEVPSKKLREILALVEEDMKKGDPLSESLGKHKKYFPQLLISMIESGEVSGNIDEMMYRMSLHFEKENKISNKVKSAMVYPIILSLVSLAAVTFIMVFVMPTFIDVFKEQGVELPLLTKVLLAISSFLINQKILVVVIIAVLIILSNTYRKSKIGVENISKLVLKLPVIGELNKKIIVSRFTRTLSTLLSSGISLVQALPVVAGVLDNKIAEEAILTIREKLVKGDVLSKLVREHDIFPKMLSSMIKIGEESGALDDILNKTADFYEDEVEQTIQTTTALMEPLLIVIMGIVIGVIVLSIMLPMFNMYSQI